MSKSIFTAPHFNDEQAAYDYVEARIWANGRVRPKCGVIGRSGRLSGKTDRPGLYKCYACRKKFTVKMGTVFEDSHIHMRDWLTAIHLICSSKKGISANQLHRTLGITLKSAWFMGHRIREAMRPCPLAKMGGAGSIVEIDETFIGKKEGAEVRRGGADKNIVLSLIERKGSVRSFHVQSTKREDIIPIVKANIAKETYVMSDESNTYSALGDDFAAHGMVDHSRKEWGWTDRKTGTKININSAEGYYSVFKRGMIGIYQHCKEKHLHRYTAEFDFRHSNRVKLGVNDVERADRALVGVKGKRLTYRPAD